jgi:hypothetical protein
MQELITQAERQSITSFVDWSQEVRLIDSTDRYREAELILTSIITLRKGIAEKCDPAIKAAKTAHTAVLKIKQEADEPLKIAERTLRDLMAAYQAEQERILITVRTEALHAAAEEAARLLESGEDDLEAAAAAALPALHDEQAPLGEATTSRTTYQAEVTDLFALVEAVARRQVLLTCLEANQAKLNELARRHRDEFNVPGCRLVKKAGIVMKRAKKEKE